MAKSAADIKLTDHIMKMRYSTVLAIGALCLFSCFTGMPGLAVETTLYVGKHFEVRDHDQPAKYVFNGDTRIARITGSLSTNTRIQRFRLRAGWNLLSLAVSATNLSEQLQRPGVVASAHSWNAQTGTYSPVPQVAPSGMVLWINATTNTTLAVVGTYAEPVNRQITAGATYLAGTGLEAWTPTLPPSVAAWSFDSQASSFNPQPTWHVRLTGDLSSINDLPNTFPPGQALYVINNAPFELEIPDPALRIRYYHQDHLGSSSVMTDASGVLVEETAFYPCGVPRHEHLLRSIEEHYKFTQKERDRESGLHYFEARYLGPLAGRFLSPDPLPLADAGGRADPQEWNCYAYALNNPLRYVDPHGLYVWDDSLGGSHKDSELKGEIVAQRQAIRIGLKQALKNANTLPNGANKDFVLRGLNVYGVEGNDNNVSVGNLVSKGATRGHTGLEDGRITVSLVKGMSGWFLGMILAHEGTHAADGLAFYATVVKDLKKAKSGPLNMTKYEREFRGWKAGAILLQASSPKVPISLENKMFWDPRWKPRDIEKNRTAAINAVVDKNYGVTSDKPGDKLIPP